MCLTFLCTVSFKCSIFHECKQHICSSSATVQYLGQNLADTYSCITFIKKPRLYGFLQ